MDRENHCRNPPLPEYRTSHLHGTETEHVLHHERHILRRRKGPELPMRPIRVRPPPAAA
jgi:hypothetical protein